MPPKFLSLYRRSKLPLVVPMMRNEGAFQQEIPLFLLHSHTPRHTMENTITVTGLFNSMVLLIYAVSFVNHSYCRIDEQCAK